MKFLAWIGTTVLSFLALMLASRVLLDLWRWFIEPFGAVPLTFWWAAGVLITFSFFKRGVATHQFFDKDGNPAKGTPASMMSIATNVLLALMSWAYGGLIHFIMTR